MCTRNTCTTASHTGPAAKRPATTPPASPVYRTTVNTRVEVEQSGDQHGDEPATNSGVNHLLTPPPNLKSGSGSELILSMNSSNSFTFRLDISAIRTTTTMHLLMRFGKATLERLMIGDRLIGEYLIEELE